MLDDQVLFHCDGDLFVPTEAAGNPWGELTGGGPVSALLAHCIERSSTDPDVFLARLTVDLMRPVPRTPLSVSITPMRTGKRLRVVRATLSSGDTVLTHTTAQLLRRTAVDGPETSAPTPFPGPDGIADGHLLPPELGLRWGVHDVIRVRWLADQRATERTQAWMRMPLPLLPEVPLSPLAHVAVLADCISAASPVGPIFGPWINTDLSVYLHRPMAGDWLGMEMRRHVERTGIGVADARLFDQHGHLGTAQEAVLVNQLG